MLRLIQVSAALVVLSGALSIAAPEASAHGWRHHHHHHYRHRHHRGWVHSYEPRYHWTSVGLVGWGCGLRQFITRHGALAYREVCY